MSWLSICLKTKTIKTRNEFKKTQGSMSKKSDKIKLNQTKNIKKLIPFISGLSFVSVSTLLVATSIGLSTQSTSGNFGANGSLVFDNKTFKNKDELMEYAQKSYYQRTETTDNRISWSIDERGEKVYFNDPALLREHLLKNIKQTSALSSKNFNTNSGGLGEINANDFSNLYFNKTQDELKTNIYRGKNNSIHTSVESAKDSYLSIHDAYYFNNVYFRNIEELKLYLQTVYYVPGGPGESKTKSENIGIVGPNGIISSGINSNDLYFNEVIGTSNDQKTKTLQAKNDFMNNISNQAKKYIEFQDMNGKYFYSNESDLNNPNSELLDAFNNPAYTKQQTNQGKGSYIVDLHQDDENTLFGPYYLQTSGNIGGIKNLDGWKKTDRDDPLITTEQNSNTISGLLNIILFEDNELTSNYPLNIKYLNEDIIVPFYKNLEANNSTVYNDWIKFSEKIKSGKRANTFYNLPIFYFFLIQNLIKDGANQKIIIEAKNVFNSIAKYLDETIKILLPAELLEINEPNSKYGAFLSFEEIFNFNSNDIDLNTDIPYFINEISDNFSQFIVAINIISQANANAMYNGGVLPYRQDYFKKILKNKPNIMKDSPKMIALYEGVWDMFSSNNINDLRSKIESKNYSTKFINSIFLDDLATFMSVTNSLFSGADKFTFMKNFSNIQLSGDVVLNDIKNLLGGITYNVSNMSTILKLVSSKDELIWENFMLIKFIHKAAPVELLNIGSFGGDQNDFRIELTEIIKKISLDNYVINFFIEPTITKSLISVVADNLGEYYKDYFLKINSTKVVIKVFDKILNTLEDFKKVDSANAIKILKSISDSPLLSSISKSIPYLQVAMIALDLLKGALVPVREYSSYKFTLDDGKSFIWNGGQRTTMFWGLWETNSVTIENMKLLDPQEVVKAKNEDNLYFNGKTYSETNLTSLKIDQLKAILNGEFSSENIKIVYSFDNISTIGAVPPSISRNEKAFYNFGTIDDLMLSTTLEPYDKRRLVKYVYNAINNGLFDPNHSGKQYYRNKFKFANGVVVDNINGAEDLLIREVIDKIQPVKIASLPKIKNNKPKYSDNGNNEDSSVSHYTLPSLSWNSGRFFTNETSNKYIIFDPNQENESGSTLSAGDSERNVRTLFHDYFDVDYKTIIKNEISTNNVFSELSSSIISNVIFQVKLSNNLTKYFFDEVSAFNWLSTQKNFTLYSYNTENHIFKYKDIIFKSKDEFIKFVLKETTTEVN
ncbi:MAG: hypothetical protein KFW07_03570 [Mycoplasmataceae bacterium]|nr:hypothetical protein [Mycoplasmataceae bacterium]